MKHTKKFLVLLVLVLFFLIGKIKAQEMRKEPQLISEKKLMVNDVIMNAHFGEGDKFGTNPKVVVGKKSIIFFDDAGKVKKEVKFRTDMSSNRVYFSKKKTACTVLEVDIPINVDPSVYYGKDMGYVATTLNVDGDTIMREISLGEVYSLAIADNGKAILTHGESTWPLDLVTPDGRRELQMHGGFSFTADFSDDSRLAVINTGGDLYLYDINLDKVLWRYDFGFERKFPPITFVGDTKISPDGKYILTAVRVVRKENTNNSEVDYHCYFCFSINGELLWKKEQVAEIGSIYVGGFSPDSKYCAFFMPDKGNRGIALFEVETGKQVWFHSELEGAVISLHLSLNGEYTLIEMVGYRKVEGGAYRDYNSRYIYLFNKQGNKIWEKKFTDKYIDNNYNIVKELIVDLSNDGKKIIIADGNNLFIYNIK